jgi:TonB-dependent starch-binding outer membrane protein SusC
MIPTAYCQIGPGISSVPSVIPSRLQTKIWLVMKMTAFLLLVTCLHVSASGYSQNISLSVKEAPLEKVFKEIQRQSGYSFWYKTRQLDKALKVTLDLRNATLEEVLSKCFENQPYEYTIVEQTVVIRRREIVLPDAPPPVIVRGKVTTAAGKALSGVSVTIRATKKGTTTDENGDFSISARKEDVLVFSYVGYDTREIKVGDQASIDISLVEASTSLNEIAVIGYGRTSRKSLTSAITTLKPEELNVGAITDVGQLLQGKVAGLNITANGDPNQTAAVILRGASTINQSQSPFYVIDGIPGADISLIAPADILSIDVLKDAAATAIYGNRASNGVIMVTTRKGKAGDPQVAYNGYGGLEKVSRNLKVMTAPQLRAFLAGNGEAFSPADDKGANTNWQKAIEKDNAFSQSHNIAMSGGTDHSDYIASLNYAFKNGILEESSLQRIIARLAVNQSAIKDKVKLGLNVTYSNSNSDDVPYRSVTLLQAAQYLPVSPIKNADGSYFEDFSTGGYYNPVAMTNHSTLNTKNSNFVGNLTAQVKLPFSLTYNMDLSYQSYIANQGQYLDSYFTDNFNDMYNNPNPGLSGHSQQVFGQGGQASRASYTNTSLLFEDYLTWDRHFGEHHINAVVGYSWQDFTNNDGFTVTTANFPADNISYNNLALSNPYALSGYQVSFGADGLYNQTRLISDFGRLTYDYNQKYLLQASIRRDGSSVFGTDHQWGYFPSVGVAWRLSQERFMLNQNLFTDLKLRASYGVTGNATGFSAYTAQSISGSLGTYYYDGTNTAALGATQQANPALKWEKTASTDIGVDFTLVKGIVSGAIDVYNKTTTGMIYSYKVDPILVPSGTVTANGGSMNNKGIELALGVTPIAHKNFKWTSSLNLAHNTNKIKSLDNPLFSGGDSVLLADPEGAGQSGSTVEILKSGKPLGQFFSLEYAGQNASGVSQYVSATGKLTTTPTQGVDYHYLSNAQPKLLLGWANNFRYRQFDLNIFLRGTFGNHVFNATRADLFRPATAQYTNILADAAHETTADYNSYLYSSRFIESGSYLRLDNASLGYTLHNLGEYVKSLRFYVTGNNLFVITGYKGIDPEINQGGLAPGVDYNNFYPKTRTFLLGVNVSF